MRVGVVGAEGVLGRRIVARLERAGANVIAVDTRQHVRPGHSGTMIADGLARVLADLDAVLVAAPLPDAVTHRAALHAGCHAIDVTVGDRCNRQLLSLDDAVDAGRSVVAMAGFAPGLTGLLGTDLLATFAPEASSVVAALLQSPTGAAGVQGAREMLDLLTDPDAGHRPHLVLSSTGQAGTRTLLGLRNIEPEMCGVDQHLELATEFCSRSTHTQLQALRLLRRAMPGVYAWLRDRIADRKAQATGRDETTMLSAVALSDSRQPVGGRLLAFASDYGATAAVAAAVTQAAAAGQLPPGAGHLSRFVSLEQLLATSTVLTELQSNTGPLPVDRHPVSGP